MWPALPNGSLEPTGRPTALPRPERRPGRPAAHFRRYTAVRSAAQESEGRPERVTDFLSVWWHSSSCPFERCFAPASWSAPRSGSRALHHERVRGSRWLFRWLFENAIVERPASATDALHHVRSRPSSGASQRINPQCSVVRTDSDSSISRARAVAELRMLRRVRALSTVVVPSPTAPHPLEHVRTQRFRQRLTFRRRTILRGAFAGGPSVRPACAA